MRCNSVRKASTDAAPCAAKVAHATPATPIFSQTTKKISRRILLMEEPMRNYSGVRLSPREVKMPLQIL